MNRSINASFITAVVGASISVLASTAAQAETIYNSIPSTLDPSYYSLGFQATQTFEFGDRITFGGTNRQLSAATFTMVNWARYEDYNAGGQYYDQGQWVGNGFSMDFTLNLYEAGTGTSHGALIASVTQEHFIAYRPTGWAYNGYAQNITFDLSSLGINLPESVVWGLAYNTQTWGADPFGVNGPYNSLNMGLNTSVGGGVTVGSTDLDTLFWDTATAGWYTDGGAAGVNIFREDTNWLGYNPMASFEAVPGPGGLALLGGMRLMGSRRRRS